MNCQILPFQSLYFGDGLELLVEPNEFRNLQSLSYTVLVVQ